MAVLKHRLRPRLGRLRVRGMRLAVGDHAGLEHALPLAWGIKAIRAVDRGASEVEPDRLGPLLPGVEPLRPQDQVRLRPGSAWQGSHHRALGVGQGADCLALVVFGSRIPQSIPPLGATVSVPASCRTLRSSRVSEESWATLATHAGQSAPASAPGATTWSTVGSCRAGGPLRAVGTGRHCHGIPV